MKISHKTNQIKTYKANRQDQCHYQDNPVRFSSRPKTNLSNNLNSFEDVILTYKIQNIVEEVRFNANNLNRIFNRLLKTLKVKEKKI